MNKKKVIVLTGAGISAESGLKTFRDSDGLWMGYNIEAAATPNAAHIGLAELEKDFDVTIVTQNIDDLHERGGSSNIIHLHGEIFKMRSTGDENKIYEIRGDIKLGDLAEDGRQLRPHIVWFEEPVPLMEKAAALLNDCD